MARAPGTVLGWLAAAVTPLILLATSPANPAGKDADDEPTAEQREQSANNLKQFGIALHNYNATFGRLPASANLDGAAAAALNLPALQLNSEELARFKRERKGQLKVQGRDVTVPLVSWRVLILPYIEEQQLYNDYRMHEPWDSEHNKKLLARMPKLYAPVRGKTREPYTTHYQVFTGKDTPFNGMIPPQIPASFPDGLSNTFLVVEAGEPVPWTRPDDLAYQAGKSLPKLRCLYPDGFYAGFGDGSVHFIRKDTDEKTIRALITPAGGEAVKVPGR